MVTRLHLKPGDLRERNQTCREKNPTIPHACLNRDVQAGAPHPHSCNMRNTARKIHVTPEVDQPSDPSDGDPPLPGALAELQQKQDEARSLPAEGGPGRGPRPDAGAL